MIWQKLKTRLAATIQKIEGWINRAVTHLSLPLNLFRFLVILTAADFIAFMSLTHSSYLQLLNPLGFLWAAPGESRKPIDLYFPRSLSLTGIEKIYAEEGTALEIKEREREAASTVISEVEIKNEIVAIKKLVAAADGTEMGMSKNEAMARRVVLELIAGPAGETETLKARNVLKEPLFLRSIWTYGDTVYLSTEKSVWSKLKPNEAKIAEYCLTESLKNNLGSQKFAILRE